MSKPMQILKEPFIQFLLIGGLVFIAYNSSRTAEQARTEDRITIDKPTQEWIYGNFTKQFRRKPTHVEMDALISAHIVSEVKYRHALEMGLDEKDSIVRRRMMQKFDFLFGNAAADALPEDAVLHDWYEANPDDFLAPATVSFSHLYFSPDNRDSAGSDAVAALQAFQENTESVGDRFPFDVTFTNATPPEVRNVLGPEFTAAVFDAPVGVWSGPIRSGLGFHLVNVSEVTPGMLPPFEEAREGVLQQWREEESKRILLDLVAELESRFEIELDEESLTQFEYSAENEVYAP